MAQISPRRCATRSATPRRRRSPARTVPARTGLARAALAHAVLAWVAAGVAMTGCQSSGPPDRQVRVLLTFENVRTFTVGNARTGPSEWDLVEPVARRYHLASNIYGVQFSVLPQPRPGNAAPGLLLTDYSVDMVVQDFARLAELDREIRSLNGRPVGPSGERAQLSATRAGLGYRGGFVQAGLQITARGQVDPGSIVFVFDEANTLRQAAVDANGVWSIDLGVAPGKRFIYGYAMSPDTPGTRRCFRIDIFTRRQQEVVEATFDRLRSTEP